MGSLLNQPWWVLALASALCVVGTARATRLITHDSWPPMRALRDRWVAWSEQTRPVPGAPGVLGGVPQQQLTWRYGWGPLLTCPFCASPYVVLVSLGWAYWSGLDVHHFWGWLWWAGHLWFSLMYLASMLVVRDEPEPVE